MRQGNELLGKMEMLSVYGYLEHPSLMSRMWQEMDTDTCIRCVSVLQFS